MVEQVHLSLKAQADEKVAESSQRFFKEPIAVYGVKSAEVKKIANTIYRANQPLSKEALFEVCSQLWESGIVEAIGVACAWSDKVHTTYEITDIEIFERWLKNHVTNWATCDMLCNHSVGTLVEMYPSLISRLKVWSVTEHQWLKRGAAVSLIIPARRGLFLPDIFEIADNLLLDQKDLVQKGYGWMLKAASEAHPQAVFEYVMVHRANMPRTALRYAIEKMPEALRAEAMKK